MSADTRRVYPVVERRRFFDTIVTHLRRSLPLDLRAFTHRGNFNLMKIWWDNPRVHFEVAIDQTIDRIEVGLHCEDGPASTLAYLAVLDARIVELKHALGHEVELERWTRSWGRLYELVPLDGLDARAAARCSHRVELMIVTLQPIIVAANIPAERSALG